MEPDLKEWVWYNLKGITTRKKELELLRIFDSPVQIYNADNIALSKTGILSKENISTIYQRNIGIV